MRFAFIALLALSLTGCSAAAWQRFADEWTPQSVLRERYIEDHPEVSETKAEWIRRGAVGVGMTYDEVVASVGRPLEIESNTFGTKIYRKRNLTIWMRNGLVDHVASNRYGY